VAGFGKSASEDGETGRIESVVVGHENPHGRSLLLRIARWPGLKLVAGPQVR
jgi:hypothetical protein